MAPKKAKSKSNASPAPDPAPAKKNPKRNIVKSGNAGSSGKRDAGNNDQEQQSEKVLQQLSLKIYITHLNLPACFVEIHIWRLDGKDARIFTARALSKAGLGETDLRYVKD